MPQKTAELTRLTLATIDQFNRAFDTRDVDGIMQLMTDDCRFENTSPAPDGTTYVGQAEVRAFWEAFFRESSQPRFETEELFAVGDRCVVRWIYSWGDGITEAGHVRGVDIFVVRDGKVAEKLSYVKG